MATPVATFCDDAELAALSAMFKGNATAARAFCQKLAIVGSDGHLPLGDRISGIEEGVNTFFLTINGALVFIMHAGFAMVNDTPGCSVAKCYAATVASVLKYVCIPPAALSVSRGSTCFARE
eukprot:GHUV01041732.1.p1 GENE.GHUV01041732.1~~GHUV01041732.1.p1  ORF type:complete len:122 (-),score=21.56 GHUV01041732.1:68-433(-)